MASKVAKYIFCIALCAVIIPQTAFSQFRFEDVTIPAGISAQCSETGTIGPGVVVFDFDNDGWEDIYTSGGVALDHLWKNMGDGTFKDVSDSNFKNKFFVGSYSHGGSAFDFDGDGLTDLYICCEKHDILLKNMGNGVFTDVTKAAHIARPLEVNESNGSSFGDFDGDGDNDLYVARWEDGEQRSTIVNGQVFYYTPGFPNQLYINNGNGTFTESAFPYHVDGDTGTSNIALFYDIDRDGDLDLIVGNDFGDDIYPNIVYKNMLMETGTASFVDVTDSIGMREALFCMGVGPFDYNRDGLFDFYETSIGPEVLLKNTGGHWQNASVEANIPNGVVKGNPDYNTVTWSPVLYDFDNDGWEDGFIVHGYISRLNTLDPDTSYFIHNLGGYFVDCTDTALGGQYLNLTARGGVGFDFDKDGYYDIALGSLNEVAGIQSRDYRLLHNITPKINHNPGHMLELKFRAMRTAHEGIGTIADVWAGGIIHSRQVSTGGGFASQTSLIQHVGLGEFDHVDSIIVYWPADKFLHRQIDRYYNIPADQLAYFQEKMDSTSQGLIKMEQLNTPAFSVHEQAPTTSSIELYPQPATTRLNIDGLPIGGAPVNYEVYNILGQRMMSGIGSNGLLYLDIASLPAGSYIFRAVTNGELATKQFMKE